MTDPSLNSTSQDDFTDAELSDVQENARARLRIWKRRFVKTGALFLTSCASVYPFLYGHSLHSPWESLGQYLVLFCMGFVLSFVYCGGTTWVAWLYLRDLEKIK